MNCAHARPEGLCVLCSADVAISNAASRERPPMRLSHAVEALRGQVMACFDRLVSPGDMDEADRTAGLRLVFELDRLGDRIEELCGAAGGGA